MSNPGFVPTGGASTDTPGFYPGSPTIQQINAAAAQLVGSSLSSYGSMPDPRLAVEAMVTGTAPIVSAAAQSGDPLYTQVIPALPQATSLTNVPTSAPDVLTWDSTASTQYNMRLFAMKSGAQGAGFDKMGADQTDQQFKSLGIIPIANIGWVNSVRNADPTTVHKLQAFLNSTGFAGNQPLTVSGTWDQHTDAAFHSYLISRFMPDALFSKDEATQLRARQFLTSLDPTFNPDSLQQQAGRDPEFQTQVVTRWLHTHGPDTSMRSSISEWAQKYGTDVLPQGIKNLQGDFWSNLGDSLSVLPVIGNIAAMPINLAKTGHLGIDALYRKTSDLEADLTNAQMTSAEKAALAPALQDAHNSSGYLGFLDAWDRQRTTAVLSLGYFFGDVFSGRGVDNIFDSGSLARKGADAHQDNMMAGVFGDQWVHDHPALATIGNFTANIADDPLTYTGVGLEAKIDLDALRAGASLEEATSGLRLGMRGQSAARSMLLTPTSIRDAFRSGTLSQHLLDTVLTPKLALQKDMAKVLGRPGMTALDAADLLAEHDHTMLPVLDSILKAPDDGSRMVLLMKHYGEKLLTADHAFNWAAARKAMLPDYFARLDRGKQMHLLSSGMRQKIDRSGQELMENPLDYARSLRDKGMSLGMTRDELMPVLDKAMSADPNVRWEAIKQFRDLEDKAAERTLTSKGLTLSGFQNWQRRLRAGRGMREPSDVTNLYLPVRDEHGNIVEMSTVDKHFTFDTGDPATDTMLSEQADQYRAGIKTFEDQLKNVRAQVAHELAQQRGNPDVRDAGLLREAENHPAYQQAMQDIGQKIAELRDQLEQMPGKKGTEGRHPVAFTSGQFQMWGRTKYTPYEFLAYLNPVLRRAESVQSMLHMDQILSAWKMAVLMKISTAFRITLGDESGRFILDDLLNGGPLTAARTMSRLLSGIVKRRGGDTPIPQDLLFSAHRAMQGFHERDFIPFDPGSQGYEQALSQWINALVGPRPETRVWTAAMKGKDGGPEKATAALESWLKGDSVEAREFRRRADAKTPEHVRRLAEGMHLQFMHAVKYKPQHGKDGTYLLNALHAAATGKKHADKNALRAFINRNRYDPRELLPIVTGRRAYGEHGWIGKTFGNMSETFQHHVTDSWVNRQREIGYNVKIDQWRTALRKQYPELTQTEDGLQYIESRARNHARDWVKRNTYQGQRTLMATAARNVFPFFGATANFNRFVLRQYAKHPWVIRPSLELANSISATQASGSGLHIPLPGVGKALALFHLGNGDDVTWDPAHAFFFTSEGYGGFVPGVGPFIMTPLRHFAAENPDLATTLSKVPGLEYAAYDSPMLPWLEQVMSGASMAMGGGPMLEGVPLIGRHQGYYERKILQAMRAQHAAHLMGQGPETTPQSATQDVGRAALMTGLGAGSLPFNIQTQDPRQAALQPALQAWDQATSAPQKDAVIKQFPDAAPLLQYFDSRTTANQKDAIVAQSPWVSAYAAGITSAADPGISASGEPTTRAYSADLADGRLRYLTSDEYLGKLQKNDQMNEAWSLYEIAHTQYLNDLTVNGINPNSAAAKPFKDQLESTVEQIGATHRDWRDAFVKQTSSDALGLQTRVSPLSSLSTWEVIPQSGEFETQTTQDFRQLLVWRDEFATALRDLQSQRRPQTEQTALLNQFNGLIDQLAAGNPDFANRVAYYTRDQAGDIIQASDMVRLEALQLGRTA